MRLLLVEDHSDLASNIIEYLEDRSHSVAWAADGILGLRMVLSERFDVMILDLCLPGLDGIELCKQLRQLSKRATRIIILSARDSLEAKVEGLESGADDYLVKPFELKELDARLKALMRRRLNLHEEEVIQVGPLSYHRLTEEFFHSGHLLTLPPHSPQNTGVFIHQP